MQFGELADFPARPLEWLLPKNVLKDTRRPIIFGLRLAPVIELHDADIGVAQAIPALAVKRELL